MKTPKYKFDARKTTTELIRWIRNWFDENGKDAKAVIGISGGKDSATVAALCVLALGKNRVIGVLMPNGFQHDIKYSHDIVKHLGIKSKVINIANTAKYLDLELESAGFDVENKTYRSNYPARLRMTVLYSVAAFVNGRVANTCNYSEYYVGYATKFGDAAGDFSPLMHLTVQEVKAVAKVLGLPKRFIEKTPEDGLCGKSDEANLGFKYKDLDNYLRGGKINPKLMAKIEKMRKAGLHKLLPMPCFSPKHDFADNLDDLPF